MQFWKSFCSCLCDHRKGRFYLSWSSFICHVSCHGRGLLTTVSTETKCDDIKLLKIFTGSKVLTWLYNHKVIYLFNSYSRVHIHQVEFSRGRISGLYGGRPPYCTMHKVLWLASLYYSILFAGSARSTLLLTILWPSLINYIGTRVSGQW